MAEQPPSFQCEDMPLEEGRRMSRAWTHSSLRN
jgi:hypothetical protein